MNTTARATAAAIDQHVARRLRAARRAAELSQEQVAAHLGLTFQQVQKYEKGTNRVSTGRLAMLAKLYRRPLTFFFEDAPDAVGAATPDPWASFLALPYAGELVQAYLAIPRNTQRRIVADVARELAQAGEAPRLQAAE